jgi:hypothetical protein
VPMEDRNERRRRELEEILELRRSFGTLGRRLVTRQTPIQTGLGSTVVPLGAESAKAAPDADARPRGDQEPDQHQEPEQEPELEPEPELGQELERESVQAAVAPGVGEPFRIPEPPAARRRLPWLWLVALVAVFALGMAVDRVVVQPSAEAAPPASSQAAPAPSAPQTSAAPARPQVSAAPARPQVSVPESCLNTAQRADALIDLLVKRTRGIEVTKAFQAYTVASQTCRKEASSR